MVEKAIAKTLIKTINKSISAMEDLEKGLEFVKPSKAKEARGAVKIMQGWKAEIENEDYLPDLANNVGILGQ